MKPSHVAEALMVRASAFATRLRPWPGSLSLGERMGDLARALRIRRAVAEAQLAAAFPERSKVERDAILKEHYRELGRVWVEYARLPDLVRAGAGEVVAEVRGLEHLENANAEGRGVILLTGHFGNFELLGAWLGRRHPVDFVVKPLSNPRVEAMAQALRDAAGVGSIRLGMSMRGVMRALREGRWVAMLADQDARRHGVFVPFMGRAASTPTGPARLSIATGAPIIMGFVSRRTDRRLELDIDPPLSSEDPRAPDAVERLTARHTARLEAWVRRYPQQWFWLHRRWKTVPNPEGVKR
jgi:Kdo2-lipid IVA lauroyltransferase/acyltransferase